VQNLQKLDHGLISKKHGGFFAKFPEILIYKLFSNGKGRGPGPRVVNRPGTLGPPWTDGSADRGCRSTAVRSPEYGLRPLRCTKARRRRCKRVRGAQGAWLGPHRSSGGDVEAGRRRCRTGGGGAQWKRVSSVERSEERMGEVR
jgi:hypothetical protein